MIARLEELARPKDSATDRRLIVCVSPLCLSLARLTVVFSVLFLAGCSVFENCKRCNNGTWGPRDDFFVRGSYCAECRPGWSGGDCMSKPLHWESSEAPLKTVFFFQDYCLGIPAFNTTALHVLMQLQDVKYFL